MKKIVVLLLLISSFIWGATQNLDLKQNLNFQYSCDEGDLTSDKLFAKYQAVKKAVDKKRKEIEASRRQDKNVSITTTKEFKEFSKLIPQVSCLRTKKRLRILNAVIEKNGGHLSLTETASKINSIIYYLAEGFTDKYSGESEKAEEFKTAILDKRHPYLKNYLTNFILAKNRRNHRPLGR